MLNLPQQPIMRTVQSAAVQTPDIGNDEDLCLDDLMPIDLIRVHTKTDDVPTNTDEQLLLYRKAAIESAEQYTSMVFSKSKVITETINISLTQRNYMQGFVSFKLQHPSADGIVHLYGYGNTRLVNIQPRTRKIRIPISGLNIDLSSSCCSGPCGDVSDGGLYQSSFKALYRTGFLQCSDVPQGIVLGCLKYIAWCITHPGDEILAVRNRTITRSSLVDGTNNVAWASGALELWRQYDPEAI